MGITHPIKFNDLITLNKVHNQFLNEIKNICQKHNVPEYSETVNLNKDDKNLEFYILKMGSYGKGTDDEKAHKEIIKAFDKIFS